MINQYALQGTPLILKACGQGILFLRAAKYFSTLSNSADVWRTLYMEHCGEVDHARGTWQFVKSHI